MAVNIVRRIDDLVKVSHVLCSVSDKRGLEEFASALIKVNPSVTIYSTGGTFEVLKRVLSGGNLTAVSDYTGQPEMQGGLVKTLDFKIYLGILSEKYNDAHIADLARVKAVAIDMVVVNLYPFEATVAREGATMEEARANIDIGGPCMVRASAKNYIRVGSVTDPADYSLILDEMRELGGAISLETRFRLAQKAFRHTAGYDAAIASYLKDKTIGDVKKTYGIS